MGGIASLIIDRLRRKVRLPRGVSDFNRLFDCGRQAAATTKSVSIFNYLSRPTIHLSFAVIPAQLDTCQINQIVSLAMTGDLGSEGRKAAVAILQRSRVTYIYPLR